MGRRVFGFTAAFTLLAFVTAFGLVPGCGVTPSSYCEAFCACFDCDEEQRGHCEDATSRELDDAEAAGCDGELRDYLQCYEENIDCDDPFSIKNACSGLVEVFDDCIQTSRGRTLCTAADEHVFECTNGLSAELGQCNGPTMCMADCINAASCESIRAVFGGESGPVGESLFNCLQACVGGSGAGGAGGSGAGGSGGG